MTIKNLNLLAQVRKRPENPPFYYFDIPGNAEDIAFQILVPKDQPLQCCTEDDGVTYDPDDWTPVHVWDLRYGKVFVGVENIPSYVGDNFVYNIAFTRQTMKLEDLNDEDPCTSESLDERLDGLEAAFAEGLESLWQELKELKEAIGKPVILPYIQPMEPYPNPIITWVSPKT